MFCKKCGKEINESFVVCPYCGEDTNDEAKSDFGSSSRSSYNQNYNQPQNYDSGSIGWAFLGFFFPLVGLILYLVWKDDKPKSAKAAGKGALVVVILYAILVIAAIICVSVSAALV